MKKETRLALRLALIYLAFGILWISLSDTFLASVITDVKTLTHFQIYKGSFYVAITAVLVFYLMRQALKNQSLTEEKLRDSEERWNFALEGSGDGVWDWNPQTDKAYFSKRWEEMIGFAEHEFPNTGAAWVDHLHPDDKDRILSTIQEYFAGNRRYYRVEFRMRCKDDSWKWILARGMLVNRDVNGNPLRMIGTHTDITERKRTEQALKRESEKNIALLHNASDGIHILDAAGNIIEVSDSFCDMLGYSRDEVIGMNVSRWDAGFSNAKELLAKVRQQFENPNRSQFETLHRRKDGTIIDVEVSGFPLELDGKPVLFNSSRDITKRKQIEAEVQIAATAFETQEGILISDVNNIILRVNTAFTGITGYLPEEVIGKNPRILSSGRQDASFYAAMWKSIMNTGVWDGEIWNRRKNGEIYPEHLTISAVKDNSDTVTNYVGVISDLTQSKIAEEQIKNLAFFDPLTKLPNRRLLLDRLQQSMASSARSGRNGALLFIDLDNFKALNDSYGHAMGDLLLQQVAQRLISSVRDGDTVSRFGGDEFVVLLEDFDENSIEAAGQTETVGEKIFVSLREPYQIGSHEYHGTSSIGATLFNDKHQSIDDLMKQADIAMYQAKKEGHNMLRFFDPQMQESISKRTALESDLHKAIESNQFQLYYQVQVRDTLRPFGAEALIRWNHPVRGMMSPAQFIPLAEESDLILSIGHWVLESACVMIKSWQQDELTRGLSLSVNVSAKQFRQPGFVAQIQSLVQYHAINPNLLKLELTESMLLDNIEDTIATMGLLKTLGVRFSLDDFGTGYSSLQYLKRLPLDQLKIDQSFVRDIDVDVSDRAIVRTIIAMAQNLALDIIAEGVETEEQRKRLLSKGCTNFQGYLFGRPMPIDQFEAQLKRG